MSTPIPADFEKGYLAFQEHAKRDAMYKIVTFLVDHFWEKPAEMADSLGVLLLTWNQSFYRFGSFDFDKLEECISKNLPLLDKYRNSSILDYTSADDEEIERLFQQFLDALQIQSGKKKGAKSPVSVAKALHPLAPDFFPLWDNKIAQAYGCAYSSNPAKKYLMFINESKEMVEQLQSSVNAKATGKKFLKLIDEYNYAKYTRGWI